MTENGIAPAPPDDDRTPTQADEAPPIKPADAWVMPEPVFRHSDGFTPRVPVGNEDPTITPDSLPTLEIDPAGDSENAVGSAAAVAAIAEQPDILTDDAAELKSESVAPPVKKKGGFLRLLMMVLGITLIALVIGAAVTAVVLWYFFQVSESQNLN